MNANSASTRRRSVWTTAAGDVCFEWPVNISPTDVDDVEAFLTITIKVMRRVAERFAERTDDDSATRSLIMTSEWQPIETAPKDGTRVLASWPQDGMHTVFWSEGSWTSGMDAGDWSQPTHWMPLPSPPLSRKDAKS